ncbi:hypothetical protein AAEP93_008508 [Penicillium crustosum]
MLPSTSFAKLKLSELVANLAGEFNMWSTALDPLPKILLFQGGLSLPDLRLPHLQYRLSQFCEWTTVSIHRANYHWLDTLRPPVKDSSEDILISTFSDFVISENQDLASDPNFTSDPVSYNINASKYASSNKPRHFHTFRQRKAAHSSKNCFQNPAKTKSLTLRLRLLLPPPPPPPPPPLLPLIQSVLAWAPISPSLGVLLVVIAPTAEFIVVTPSLPSAI